MSGRSDVGAQGGAQGGAHGAEPAGGVIRAATGSDRDAMYQICVLTGAGGDDATGLYEYPSLLGDVFVGPYLALELSRCFVIDDGHGAEGYVLGCLDSKEFARRCELEWWPQLRAAYRLARVKQGGPDDVLLRWINDPPPVPGFVDRYPSHLHVDILPRWQGGGWGRRVLTLLFDALRAEGSPGVHLGVARANVRAQGFYRHLGFVELDGDGSTLWMGLDLRERFT